VVVRAYGELDVATAPAAQQALLDGRSGGPVDVVVDLAGVTFVDATGLAALLHAAEAVRCGRRRLRLASPSRMLRVMLRLLDLEAACPSRQRPRTGSASPTPCRAGRRSRAAGR
jgi:anti-sigma B factor antagonist